VKQESESKGREIRTSSSLTHEIRGAWNGNFIITICKQGLAKQPRHEEKVAVGAELGRKLQSLRNQLTVNFEHFI
jgi:hypothetical protein